MKKILLAMFAVVFLWVISGCSQFSLREVFEKNNHDTAYQLIPGDLTIQTGKSYTFTVYNGIPPYEFFVLSGNGAIDEITGKYTAPLTPEISIVGVVDSRGDLATATVSVTNSAIPLEIIPATVSVEPGESVDFSAFGGVGSYTWNLESGSVGSRTGSTFTAPNDASGTATITVTDQDVPAVSKSATITVAAPPTLTITPQDITVTVGSSVTFIGNGGYARDTADYHYGVIGDGSVNIDTGVYSASDVGSADVSVTDLAGGTATATVTVVDPGTTPPVGISPGVATVFTNGTIDLDAYGGVPPYTFAILPGPGSINPDSGLFLAPDTPGTAQVTVTDSTTPIPLTAATPATITIIAPLSISPTAASVTTGGSVDFDAAGGIGTYNFQVDPPAGGTVDGTGFYNAPGTPQTVTVKVSDSSGNEASAVVTISPPAPLGISPSTTAVLVNGKVTFTGTGGSGSYTYQKVTGGGGIDSKTGIYTAPPTPGNATVRVNDGANSADASITVVAGGVLKISPSSQTVAVDNTTSFSASGGKPPYRFSVKSGVGSVNTYTGIYTAPSDPGTATVRVTDSGSATADSLVTVSGNLCGQVFSETEPNDSIASPNDFTISLTKGCSVTINANTLKSQKDDVFVIDTGSATSVLITASYPDSADALQLFIKHDDGSNLATAVYDTYSATINWTVDLADTKRFIWVETKKDGFDYTLTVTGG